MKKPDEQNAKRSAAREESSRAAKNLYPAGRALSRIEYFEARRGLPPTTFSKGCVISGMVEKPRILKRATRSRSARRTRHYESARRARPSFQPKFAAAANLPTWASRGPALIPHGQTYGSGGNDDPSVSGRCVGIVISPTDPMHLVLCSAGGGLWESLDQGSTWRPMTDDQPTLSMGAVAAAPSSPNIVYAGTGEGDTFSQLGAGMLRSMDGGLTWQLAPASVLSGIGVYDIQVHPSDPMNVWVGTTQNLLESRNGGQTWRVVQRLTTWDISINPANPQEIFAATAAGLIRSANGGSTWARVHLPGAPANTPFRRIEVSHAPSRPGVVFVAASFGGTGRLWRRATPAGGFTTQRSPRLTQGSDIAQSWYDWCLAVAPDDPDVVYWGAVELYKGTRGAGGFRWQKVSSRSSGDSIHPDQHHIAFDQSDPAVVYVCNDGGVFRSPNRGRNWVSLNPGLDITEFEFIAQLVGDEDWMIGGTQDNGTLGFDSVRTWKQIALGDGGDCGVDDGNKLCYHSFYGMWIERAPATGANAFNWTDVSPPFGQSYSALFYPPMEVRSRVVAKAGETLFVSGNRGNSWAEVGFGGGSSSRASALAIIDDRTILLGTENGDMVRVVRGSAGWQHAIVTPLTSPRNAFISDIAVIGTTIWVTASTFGGAHVLRSQNNGQSWSDRGGGLPDVPANALVVDPANSSRVFVATDDGVYRTENSGGSWKDFSNGLPNAVVGDILLHTATRRLRVGTRSRGIWELQLGPG